MNLDLTKQITCPSGLAGTIRGLKVREERVLANKRLAKDGRQMDALLSACWLETTSPGPYVLAEGHLDWSNVLQGDRFYILLQIRALTYGDEYAFSVDCGNDNCGRKIPWTLNISNLPLRDLCTESREAFVTGRPLDTVLPGLGRRVSFRLAVGEDERRLAKLRDTQPERFLSALLSTRVVEIDGVAAHDKRRVLEDLPMADALHLVRAFEQADCGVETGIEIECSKCLNIMSLDLPLDPGFLWPSRKATASSQRCA